MENFELVFPFDNGRVYRCTEELSQATKKKKLQIMRVKRGTNALEKRKNYSEHLRIEKPTRYFKIEDSSSVDQRLCFPLYLLEPFTDEDILLGQNLYVNGPITIPDPTEADPDNVKVITFEQDWLPHHLPCFEKGSRCGGYVDPNLGVGDPTKIHDDDYYLQRIWAANSGS